MSLYVSSQLSDGCNVLAYTAFRLQTTEKTLYYPKAVGSWLQVVIYIFIIIIINFIDTKYRLSQQ